MTTDKALDYAAQFGQMMDRVLEHADAFDLFHGDLCHVSHRDRILYSHSSDGICYVFDPKAEDGETTRWEYFCDDIIRDHASFVDDDWLNLYLVYLMKFHSLKDF